MSNSNLIRVYVISFNLSDQGLAIKYSTSSSLIVVEFDIIGTCEELQSAGFISGYLKKTKFPPQIIMALNEETIRWHWFIKKFTLTRDMVQKIALQHYMRSDNLKETNN